MSADTRFARSDVSAAVAPHTRTPRRAMARTSPRAWPPSSRITTRRFDVGHKWPGCSDGTRLDTFTDVVNDSERAVRDADRLPMRNASRSAWITPAIRPVSYTHLRAHETD